MMSNRTLTAEERKKLRSIKARTQNDVITLCPRFSVWRDSQQWILYDFLGTRLKKDGVSLKDLPSGNNPNKTYHPKLGQLMDHMVEHSSKEMTELRGIVTAVEILQAGIEFAVKGYLAPLGITPADAAQTLNKAPAVDADDK